MLAALVSASAVCVGAVSQNKSKTVLDGVYTPSQAERGRDAYFQNCARCHRDDLSGNPEAMPLTGRRFIDSWREDSLFSLFDHMATRMPREPRTTLPTGKLLAIEDEPSLHTAAATGKTTALRRSS